MPRTPKKQPAAAFERTEICKTCRHCNFDDPDGLARCRRYPPIAVYDEEGIVHYKFPIVMVDWYCGEWKAKLDS